MIPKLALALLATAALAGASHAQSAPYGSGRPMPAYDDGQPPSAQGGYDDSYGTADTGHHVDQTPPPAGADGYDDAYAAPPSSGWVTPRPYARADQVDEGSPNDAAHRKDRAYTAELNRRRWAGRNAPVPAGGYGASDARYRAELAEHDRAIRQYRAAQERYRERMARWHARVAACDAGNPAACDSPE